MTPTEEPSFITGFHVHPYHSVHYLHMHVICNNSNMIAKQAFIDQTAGYKFVTTKTVLYALNPSRTPESVPRKTVTLLNNFNNKSLENFEINSRLPEKVLYVDKRCFVINNRDFIALNRGEIKNERLSSSTDRGTSRVHILVCPIEKKIFNAVTLTPDDVELLKHMRSVGHAVGRLYAHKFKDGNNSRITTFGEKRDPESKMTAETFKIHQQIFAQYIQHSMVLKNQTRNTVRTNLFYTQYANAINKAPRNFKSMRNIFTTIKYNNTPLSKANNEKIHLYRSKLDRIMKALNNINSAEKNNRRKRLIENTKKHINRIERAREKANPTNPEVTNMGTGGHKMGTRRGRPTNTRAT